MSQSSAQALTERLSEAGKLIGGYSDALASNDIKNRNSIRDRLIEDSAAYLREIGEKERNAKSGAVRELAGAARLFYSRLKTLESSEMSYYLHCSGTTPAEDAEEASALFAEYMVDFAKQAVRTAIQAVERTADFKE